MLVVASILAAVAVFGMCMVSYIVGAKYGLPQKRASTAFSTPSPPTDERMTDEEIEKFRQWDTGFRNIMGYDGGNRR